MTPLGHSYSVFYITQDMISNLSSRLSLSILYLDVGTLGDPIDKISRDLHLLEDASRELGLVLNVKKSEVTCISVRMTTPSLSAMLSTFSSPCLINPNNAKVLKSAMGGGGGGG